MARTIKHWNREAKKHPDRYTKSWAIPVMPKNYKHPEKHTGWLYIDYVGPLCHKRFKKLVKRAARNLAKKMMREEVNNVDSGG